MDDNEIEALIEPAVDQMAAKFEKEVRYGFGHLVSAELYPNDAHAGDSRDLANDVFSDLRLTGRERLLLHIAAEWIAESYQ